MGIRAIDNLLTYGPLAVALCVLFGLSFGSFLNVVVYRLPVMLARQWRAEAMDVLAITPPRRPRFDLLLPRSRCPACHTMVSAKDNVPVLSWLLLRGRCRACSASISPRYPGVELAGAALLIAVVAGWGYTGLAAGYYVFLMALLALSLIDFDTLLLPDQITLPLLWLGILAAIVFDATPTPTDAALGAVGGYSLLWLFYWGHKLITGREGMGYGDFKLLAALGAWLGWQAILPVILIASTSGLVYAAVGILRRRADRTTPIPFGTFLCGGGVATLFFTEALTVRY